MKITRCVIEQWIDNKEENFYDDVTSILRSILKRLHDVVDNFGILKPYSFVLEDDEKKCCRIVAADDDTIIIEGDLYAGSGQRVDSFLDDLLKRIALKPNPFFTPCSHFKRSSDVIT